MRLLLLFTGWLLTGNTTAQTVQSSCALPPNLDTAYRKDVASLALRRLYETRHPDTSLIVIPQVHLDSIGRPLAAIFRLDTIGETDSVFRRYCIHVESPRLPFITQWVSVRIDTSYAWTQPWLNNQTPTGYGALDSFLSRHAYSLTSIFTWSSGTDAFLQTTKLNNDYAFADSIELFPGVISAYAGGSGGDGDQILYTRDSVSHLSFILGWGDCPAGCTGKKYWNYTVTDDCIVTVDSVVEWIYTGDIRPIPQGCNLFPPPLPTQSIRQPAATQILAISPNPTSNFIQLPASITAEAPVRIYSSVGALVMESSVTSHRLDVSRLPAGVYFIKVNTAKGGLSTGRFLKQ